MIHVNRTFAKRLLAARFWNASSAQLEFRPRYVRAICLGGRKAYAELRVCWSLPSLNFSSNVREVSSKCASGLASSGAISTNAEVMRTGESIRFATATYSRNGKSFSARLASRRSQAELVRPRTDRWKMRSSHAPPTSAISAITKEPKSHIPASLACLIHSNIRHRLVQPVPQHLPCCPAPTSPSPLPRPDPSESPAARRPCSGRRCRVPPANP